ncbi:hypothetical protein FKW77_000918 [Venturia effusa]|uniref:Extracellular membrane protein CFEM domain-containing protein n=1 Tax=Venturia effusa TaxID=50376 RepID=A0A517LQN7_9PEZI|nr:hypothetical protein FKW77_000918 [Venturia effusa]
MHVHKILALPFFIAGVFAAPSELEVFAKRDVATTDATDTVCALGHCTNVGNPGPRCNIDQCLISQAGNFLACYWAVHMPNGINMACQDNARTA